MKFGICCQLEEAPEMVDAGFDYVELGAGILFDQPNAFDSLHVPATNLFFKGGYKLFGPEKTPYIDYAEKVIHAAAKTGVKVMVVGSGAARTAPEGVPASDADEEFANIIAMLSEIARPLGVLIAPESLNQTETNVANDLGELAQAMIARRLGYTADVYHVLKEWDLDPKTSGAPPEQYWIDQVPFRPAHVHFADLPRYVPAKDDPDVLAFLRRLVSLGYDERISFEGSRDGYGPVQILERMKAMWETVK